MTTNQNSSPYSIDMQKVRDAYREFQARKRDLEKFKLLYFCESSPSKIHQFEMYKPHPGTAKQVCRICACETHAGFEPSVYAYKGRRFEFKSKHKFEIVRKYTA